MKLEVLLDKLKKHNVPPEWYSLDGWLKPDSSIIFENHGTWECFYLDERGDRSQFAYFPFRELAYDWLWARMEKLLDFYS